MEAATASYLTAMLNQAGIIHSKCELYLQMQQLLEDSLQAFQHLYHKSACHAGIIV